MILQTKKRGRNPLFLTTLLFCAAVLILFLALFVPYFETSDDPVFIRMVDGAKGSTDPHLVYQNILLGFLYKLLYLLPVRLPWYSLFQYALIFLTLTAICYGIRKLLPGAIGWIWCLFVSLFLGWECYVRIQYTKTAGAAACAGVFLILLGLGRSSLDDRAQPAQTVQTLRQKQAKWRKAVTLLTGGQKKTDPLVPCGILLALAGTLMRFQQAIVCIALMSGGGLFLLLSGKNKKERMLLLRRLALSFGLLGILAVGTYLADRASYTGRMDGFLEFDQARIDLLDYGLPDFEENKEALKALGIDKSAYLLLKSWAYADPEVFTTQTLKAMAAMKSKQPFLCGSKLSAFFQEVPSGMLQRRFFYLVLAGFLFYLLLGCHKRSGILSCVYELLLFTACYYYLFSSGRYLVNRVDVPLLLAVLLVFLMLSRSGNESRSAVIRASEAAVLPPAMTCILCVLFTVIMLVTQGSAFEPLLKGSTRAATLKDYTQRTRSLIEAASADQDHLYLAKLYTLSDDYAYGVFDVAPKGCLSNILWLGGWSTYTACYRNIMEKYQVANPMKDMIDRPDIYLIDNKLKRTLKYLKSHYAPDVKAETVGTIGSFDICSVKSK